MRHFSKRTTPIMAEEAMPILGLGRDDHHRLVRSGRLARSLRDPGDPADRGQHSFRDLLACDLWRWFRLGGLSDPVAQAVAEELGDALAEGAGLPVAHPLASLMRGRHDALLGATLGVLRRTHDLLRDGTARPGGTRLLATLPSDGPPGIRVLEMRLGRPGPEGGRRAPGLANR